MLFQFHKGTIKTSKLFDGTLQDVSYFNSIKVRLKLMDYREYVQALFEFQFHKGTIKTHARSLPARWMHTFQFHKGTIKTALDAKTGEATPISIP